ncbi:integrase catalytic domain-containing protein [Trichonephila clavipes]|nr:integrase catalytic domain-containing protein [Trichonephila clavipes]
MAVSKAENASAFDGPLLFSLCCPRLHPFHRRQDRILLARKSQSRHHDAYKNDKELVQSAIDYALAEIKNKRLDSEIKLEFERIKLAQLQKQLELANIQKNLPQNSDIRNPSVFETADNNNVETLLKSVKTLTIPVPSRVESYNLFFQSLEKAFKIKEVPEQFKCEILLNILALVDVDQKIVSARNRITNYYITPEKGEGIPSSPLRR